MNPITTGKNGETPPADRNLRVRYEVTLPVSVRISRSVMTDPFQIEDAVLEEVARSGSNLFLTIKVKTQREELSRILVRRRRCTAQCHLSGSGRPSSLSGEIIWAEPRLSSQGVVVRFAIKLDESNSEGMADLRTFLKDLEAKGGTRPSS
jgi:hypothetical protein